MSFVKAADLTDLNEGKPLAVEIGGVDVALVRDGEDYYAIRDQCSHADVPLSDGDVSGCEIECWLHGSRFDLRTGRPLGLPATQPVDVYPCRVEGDIVVVDIDNPIPQS